jgi:hypothetical protein
MEVPDHDVGVFTSLSAREIVAIVRKSHTSYLVVVGGQEMLVVGVLEVTNNDTGCSN